MNKLVVVTPLMKSETPTDKECLSEVFEEMEIGGQKFLAVRKDEKVHLLVKSEDVKCAVLHSAGEVLIPANPLQLAQDLRRQQ